MLFCVYTCKVSCEYIFSLVVVLPVCVITSFIICFLFLLHMATTVQYVVYILVYNIMSVLPTLVLLCPYQNYFFPLIDVYIDLYLLYSLVSENTCKEFY